MDKHEYQRPSITPDVMPRSALQASSDVLREQFPGLADRIDMLQTGTPLPKPGEHEGGPETDYLPLVDLSHAEIEAIFDALFELEGGHASRAVHDEQLLHKIASLVDRWNEAEQFRSGPTE